MSRTNSKPGLGAVTISPLSEEERQKLRPAIGDLPCEKYIWRPAPEMQRYLPADYNLEMLGTTYSDGVRRFAHTRRPGSFLIWASLGGMAVLLQTEGFRPEIRFTYDSMRMIYQRAGHLQSFSRRRVCTRADLIEFVKDSLENEANTQRARSARGAVTELTEQMLSDGRSAATEAGITEPNLELAIRLGIREWAKEHPLRLRPSEVLFLVRHALFSTSPDTEPTNARQRAWITEQILRSLYDHTTDSTDQFNDWLTDPKGTLVRRISKKQGAPGGRVSRQQVHFALAELGWQSYRYVGQCVDLQMKAFLKSLPEALHGKEEQYFSQAYLSQSYLGYLPYLMLNDRTDFIQESIMQLREHPRSRREIGTLHRMLEVYATITLGRRAYDKEKKRQRHARNQSGKAAMELPLFDRDLMDAVGCLTTRDGQSSSAEQFKEIVLSLPAFRQCKEDFTSAAWIARLLNQDEHTLTIALQHTQTEMQYERVVQRNDVAAAAKEVD